MFHRELAQGATVEVARTAAVAVFVAIQIAYLASCRSLTGRARDVGLLTNPWLTGGVALMIALQIAFTTWPPMQALFGSAALDAVTWLEVLASAVVAWGAIEAEKAWRRRRAPRARPVRSVLLRRRLRETSAAPRRRRA